MRDKDLCRTLEAIYRLFAAVTHDNRSTDTPIFYNVKQVPEDMAIIKREIEAMGGSVD